MTIPFAIVIFFLFANLVIPLFLYHRRYGLFKGRYKGRGGCNGWSFIMDGLAAGMVNLVVAKYLLEARTPFFINDLIISFLISFIIMFLTHVWMSYRKWEIWIMPKPWKWNEGGYWHMVSMTLQTAFLAYPVVLLRQNDGLGFLVITKNYLLLGFLGILLFLWAFTRADRDLKIGRFILRSKAW